MNDNILQVIETKNMTIMKVNTRCSEKERVFTFAIGTPDFLTVFLTALGNAVENLGIICYSKTPFGTFVLNIKGLNVFNM
ncbi:MAG: hypothetical protein E7058_10170 [Lentisphaerae bacterium]|nr:hypothetical protein [Lentisphaerota bacterium]